MRSLPPLALALVLVACGDKEPEKPSVNRPAPSPAAHGSTDINTGTLVDLDGVSNGLPDNSSPAGIDQSSPKALAEGIFAAARSGDFALLKGIADVDADKDSKNVANVADAPPEGQTEFKKHFATGKVNGEVKLKGDEARVPILFGPDGLKPETFQMVKRDGKWYLKNV